MPKRRTPLREHQAHYTDLEENPKKKIKLSIETAVKEGIDIKEIAPVREKCNICRQYLDNISLYNGHPNNAEEEYITLINEKLSLFNGDEDVDNSDERPTHNITLFSVYDKNGHLCSFDTGLIEANQYIFFSGYVKPIYDDDETSTDNGLPTKDMGPINEWFISGFDGGQKDLIGFSTSYAEYYLQMPSPEYEPFMSKLKHKIRLTKLVIEFLLDRSWERPSYEELLQHIEGDLNQELTEDMLLLHAQFICDQVLNCDYYTEDGESLLITTPCMRTLVKLAGVTFKKRKQMRKMTSQKAKSGVRNWSKATTTNLVRQVFETFFVGQIDGQETTIERGPKRKRCGVCEACQTPDCGKCSHCRNMVKFGGSGRRKQACSMRLCPYMAIQEAEDESDAENEVVDVDPEHVMYNPISEGIVNDVEWIRATTREDQGRCFYDAAKIGNVVIEVNDYVMLNSQKKHKALLIAKVVYMWEENDGKKMFHASMFCRGIDTVLGETAGQNELFATELCKNCPLGSIVRKTNVVQLSATENWSICGGLDGVSINADEDDTNFYYSKLYHSEFSRFEDLKSKSEDVPLDNACELCKFHKENCDKPTLKDGIIYWKNEMYTVGSGVFLQPGVYHFREDPFSDLSIKPEKIDLELYPEAYRKTYDSSSSNDAPEPFNIGLIEEIKERKSNILIKVRKFYRPENTCNGKDFSYSHDLHCLYWSDRMQEVNFEDVCGKCFIQYADTLTETPWEWSRNGPYRFYFEKGYEAKWLKFIDVPQEATKMWQPRKSKNVKKRSYQTAPDWQKLTKPLKCMDLFAGCGGLAEGFHQCGVAETLWAIEKDPQAARAFKLNNPDTIVFADDCNEILRLAMAGKTEYNGKRIPKQGEIEMLIGGPPCQGFSGMNRFNAGQYSQFKNSLVASYLSYCDYYRPNYLIFENVRNFVMFKKSIVLKLTIRCLLAIGYQVAFGIVQAGNYGVPQTRRRLIIMGAAPGFKLPKFPNPQHVFSKRGCQLSVPVGDLRFHTDVDWFESAPYRAITVKDAMGDLPKIVNGHSKSEMAYDCDAESHFQKIMRGPDAVTVKDHICKLMAPIVEARMSHIPLNNGADWRDLPNISVRLNDGTYTNTLVYSYFTKKQNKCDPPRGVCLCASGKGCDPLDRQYNTLIPWCLPHTADRHNHWAGLYGRLQWDGYFGTTVTNPEPMGKQGRVLHPEQHRVVSLRECARSQGFPDRYQFSGNLMDKYRQIGNAVPPPLALAIGRQVMEAILTSTTEVPAC